MKYAWCYILMVSFAHREYERLRTTIRAALLLALPVPRAAGVLVTAVRAVRAVATAMAGCISHQLALDTLQGDSIQCCKP